MTARMVNAIPTANTSLAGFGAICSPSWRTRSLGRIVRTEPGEMYELFHTSLLVQKMMGFIVSKRLGSPYRSGRSRHWIKSKNRQHQR